MYSFLAFHAWLMQCLLTVPPSLYKTIRFIVNVHFYMFLSQTCNGTLCLALDLEPCECSTMAESCHVCCVLSNSMCVSTIQIASMNISGLQSRLPGGMGGNRTVGTPCANFTGYCDLLSNCMAVDENGALFRLANLFFNSELLRRFLDFASQK